MSENDQHWIYDNYTCLASNAIGTANSSIELRRARMFPGIDITQLLFTGGGCDRLFEQL